MNSTPPGENHAQRQNLQKQSKNATMPQSKTGATAKRRFDGARAQSAKNGGLFRSLISLFCFFRWFLLLPVRPPLGLFNGPAFGSANYKKFGFLYSTVYLAFFSLPLTGKAKPPVYFCYLAAVMFFQIIFFSVFLLSRF